MECGEGPTVDEGDDSQRGYVTAVGGEERRAGDGVDAALFEEGGGVAAEGEVEFLEAEGGDVVHFLIFWVLLAGVKWDV